VGTRTRDRRTVRVIHLLRKPLSESSVAANILAHGTGALHIDACRVFSSSLPPNPVAGGLARINRRNAEQGYRPSAYADADEGLYVPNPGGRWPTNLILEHLPECEGECADGCPVAEVDVGGTQTRDHAKRDTHQETLHASHVKFGHSEKRHQFTYGDGGGSARYFKQVHCRS
jgi:hypothetical protein